MALPDWLMDMLVCPERKDLRLRWVEGDGLAALNRRIAGGGARNRKGEAVVGPIREGLLREDGLVLYPVREGIPVLLVEEGIPLEPGDVA